MSDDEPTCGKGLAEHAVIPQKLGDLLDGLADNLEQHLPSLVQDDAVTRAEHAAYSRLLSQHRDIARRLHAVAAEMASCHDLPMGAHDEQVLGSPAVMTAFQHYITTVRKAVATLQASLARDEQLLG